MGERGLVVDQIDENVVVKLQRTEACAKCKACTAGMMSEEMILNAKNICNAKKNDWVNIELDATDFLKAVSIMYGVPFITFIIGIVVGYNGSVFIGMVEFKELISFIVGLIFTVLTYLFIKSKEEVWKSKNFIPVATHIVE